MLNNDNNANANAKNKKNKTNPKNDENKNILVEHMKSVDDILFKEYSNYKNFSSFINEFDRVTNEEDKGKVVKEIKDMTSKWMKIVNTDLNYLILLMILIIFCMNSLRNEREILNEKKHSKIIKHFLCMYKMYLISAEKYKNAKVDFLTIKTTSEIWVSIKDVESGMGVINISNLILKEIYVICETKNITKEQVNDYKMTKR